jgi:hypothetical protein
MSKAFLFRLKCGQDELDLTDWNVFFPLQEGHTEQGEAVMLPLYVNAGCGQSAALSELLHKLEVYNQRAFEYEDAGIGQPVLLGMKLYDGNTYDTTFGRGWVYKYLLGTASQRAIEVETQYDNTIGLGYISALTLLFHCKARIGYAGSRVYAWEPLHAKWVGNVNGAATLLPNGGVLLPEGMSNLLSNSDFEYEADPDNQWTADAGLTPTVQTDEELVCHGFASMKLVCSGGADRDFVQSVDAGGAGLGYIVSFSARRLDGAAVTSADVVAHYAGSALASTFEECEWPGWYRVWAACTSVAGAQDVGCTVKSGRTVIVDSFQFEHNYHPSPVICGNLGRGHDFSGPAHLSSSVRYQGTIVYPNTEANIPRILPLTKATILFVWKCPEPTASLVSDYNSQYLFYGTGYKMALQFVSLATGFRFSDGTNNADVPVPDMDEGDVLFFFCRYGPGGIGLWIHRDGTLLGSATGAYSPTTPSASVTLNGGHGEILEMQVWPEELTATQMNERQKRGYGRAEIPFVWTASASLGAGLLQNQWGPLRNQQGRIAEFDNIPGDTDAGLKLFTANYSWDTTMRYLYLGQMRRGVGRQDVPSKRNLAGCFYNPDINFEDGESSYDADTVTIAEPTECEPYQAFAGAFARVNPSTLDEVKRINVPVCNEPENLWQWVGRWRLLAKVKTAYAERFKIRFRAVVAGCPGDYTEQVYADGNDVWRILNPDRQIINIPTAYIAPETVQRYKPGDWDSSADGPFAYLEVYVQAESLGGVLDMDCIVLLPQDQEAFCLVGDDIWSFAEAPSSMKVLCLDTCSHEFAWGVVEDDDFERFVGGFDFSGARFTLGLGRPNAMAFLCRRNTTGGLVHPGDTLLVSAKIAPRYWLLR